MREKEIKTLLLPQATCLAKDCRVWKVVNSNPSTAKSLSKTFNLLRSYIWSLV